MVAPSRNSVEANASPRRRKSSVRLANAKDQAAPSPVLQWQEALHEQWAQSERRAAEPPKWSQRRTLAFIILTCGAFWAVVVLSVAKLAR